MNDIRIEDFPAELLFKITENLLGDRAFGSVASFALCNRRLRGVLPLLYRNVGRINLDAGEDALIWATENDELETLKLLLEAGVDPNALFWSCLPDWARQDVFAAQCVRPRVSPRLDGHLLAKLLQEEIVQYQTSNASPGMSSDETVLLREWYLATVEGNIPEDLDVLDNMSEIVRDAKFGCRLSTPNVGPRTANLRRPRDLYFWSALHLATKQGNDRAVELLIAHGADIESRCQGLCDCLTPYQSVGWLTPPSFSPLHIAVCFGHQHLAHIFLARGANLWAAGEIVKLGNLPEVPPNQITVFHTAALKGNVSICQLLYDHHVASGPEDPTRLLRHQDVQEHCALEYAVVAGHMRTTGGWLFDQGVGHRRRYDFEGFETDSLTFLCHQGRYRDAHYFLNRIRPSHQMCSLVLQSCFLHLKSHPISVVATLGSLRTYYDKCMAVGVSGDALRVEPDSEEDLAYLIRELLDRGANPIANMDTDFMVNFSGTFGKSALHLAAGCGQRAALRVMLDAGAPIESGTSAILPSYSGDFPGATPLTPLGCAMLPPRYSLGYNDPRVYLGTIIFLLERGASFTNSLICQRGDNFRNCLSPLFSGSFGGVPWYNLNNFDLFERVMELAAKNLGQERLSSVWLADLMKMAITCKGSNGNFCKWLVQRYGVVSTSLSDHDLSHLSPGDPMNTRFYKSGIMEPWDRHPAQLYPANFRRTILYKQGMIEHWESDIARHLSADPVNIPRYKPAMMDFLLDFIRDPATIHKLHGNPSHSPAFYTHNGLFIALGALVARGSVLTRCGHADSKGKELEEPSTQLNQLTKQCCALIMEASRWCTHEGALELIRAVLSQLPKIGLGDHPKGLLHRFNEHRLNEMDFNEHAISWVVGKHGLSDGRASHTPRIKLILQELLQHTSPLYGVADRRHAERPESGGPGWDFPKMHPFVYPVPIAVDMERWDLLEMILTKTAPPPPDDILETLAMALDTTYREVNPTVIRVILQHSPVDVGAVIPRPATKAETGNGVTGHVPPLYYLLKTFYNAHVTPRIATSPGHRIRVHQCKCAIITKDKYLVECVALLVKHGASWTQPSLPSGETPLDVLAAILDGEGCHRFRRLWPAHNWSTLRRHVKLDWRAADVAGRELGEGFNPVEFARLGVEASWGQEVAGLVEGGGEMGDE